MKLNNKGFAITATLYTILILFLMILVSVLSGLVNKEKLLEKSTESISENYKIVTEEIVTEENSEEPVVDDGEEPVEEGETDSQEEPVEGEEDGPAECALEAPCTGKYIFKYNDDENKKCYSYLKKESCIDVTKINYTTQECNNLSNKNELLSMEEKYFCLGN